MKHYCLQVLIALDQLVCAAFGGWADETLSSYVFRLERQKKIAGRVMRPLVDFLARVLFRQPPGHCQSAYDSERLRAHCPPELRNPS